MISRRILTRLVPSLRLINYEIAFRQVPTQGIVRKELLVPSFQSIRSYAKDTKFKDGKNKKGKNSPKVEVNEEQLSSLINLEKFKSQMEKCLTVMKDEFVKNLSIRSTTGAIETLKLNVDGKEIELQEIAQIIRKNPKTIVINMLGFPQLIPQVLQTLNKSGMNLNPQQDGTTVFIPVPKITKEHRENLSKSAKTFFIKCRDGLKDVQNSYIKKLKGNKEISIDLNHQIQQQVTAITEEYVVAADKLLKVKQSELLASKE